MKELKYYITEARKRTRTLRIRWNLSGALSDEIWIITDFGTVFDHWDVCGKLGADNSTLTWDRPKSRLYLLNCDLTIVWKPY